MDMHALDMPSFVGFPLMHCGILYKIKEVEEKTLSWGAQGNAKGLRVSRG